LAFPKVDCGSIRVVELDPARQAGVEVPSKSTSGQSSERVTICWRLAGVTPTLTERRFFAYFDTVDRGPKEPPNYPSIAGADESVAGNLVRNASFEELDKDNPNVPAGWSFSGTKSGSAALSAEEAHSGRYCIKLTNTVGKLTSVQCSQFVKLKPNTRYILRGWVKIAEHHSGGAGLTVWYLPQEGKKLPSNNKTQVGCRGASDWTRFSYSRVNYFDPVVKQNLKIDKTLPGTGGGTVSMSVWYGKLTAYFDDLEVMEASLDHLAPLDVTVGKPEQLSAAL